MAMSIAESLQFIINHPLNKDRSASKHLGPPLSNEKINEIMSPVTSSIDVGVHDDILELYKTSDGVNTDGGDDPLQDIWFLPGYYMLTLKDAVYTYKIMLESTEGDGQFWDKTWFPFLSSGAGDYYLIDMVKGTVNEFMRGEDMDEESEHVSLTDFLQKTVQHFKDGDYFMEDGQLSEK